MNQAAYPQPMGFTRAQLDSFRGAVVPDLIGPGIRLLFAGINPGLWTAAVQAHFARRGNRFYPALFEAGLTDHLIDASRGMSAADEQHLIQRGIGITNIVPRASAQASELTTGELRDGGQRLVSLVGSVRPAVVAVLGITAYRQAFNRPKAMTGKQSEPLGGAQLWVAPNPSGLNAHVTVADLAAAFRQIGDAAGL